MAYGRTALTGNNSVFPTRVSADGSPKYKIGGITVDWSSVAALGSDTTYLDGSIVRSGNKVLRFGQVMCKITGGGSQTLTGTATGGTFTLSAVRPDNGTTVTTGSLGFGATAAQVLTALQAVMAPGQVTSTSGGALGSAAVTVNFGTLVGLLTVNGASLTGGTVVAAIVGAGTTTGYFGPYDPTASDGRQSLNRGDCFIMDETVLQYSAGPTLGPSNDQVGSAIEGGDIFIDRVLQSGTVAHTLALGPTLAEVTTAFPRCSFVRD